MFGSGLQLMSVSLRVLQDLLRHSLSIWKLLDQELLVRSCFPGHQLSQLYIGFSLQVHASLTARGSSGGLEPWCVKRTQHT